MAEGFTMHLPQNCGWHDNCFAPRISGVCARKIRANGNPARYRSINDRKIGIVGFGSIGQTVARNLSGFDVEVVGFSKNQGVMVR